MERDTAEFLHAAGQQGITERAEDGDAGEDEVFAEGQIWSDRASVAVLDSRQFPSAAKAEFKAWLSSQRLRAAPPKS